MGEPHGYNRKYFTDVEDLVKYLESLSWLQITR